MLTDVRLYCESKFLSVKRRTAVDIEGGIEGNAVVRGVRRYRDIVFSSGTTDYPRAGQRYDA